MRNVLQHGAVGWTAAKLICLWLSTVRARVWLADATVDPRQTRQGYIYCHWHETLILAAHLFANCGIKVLISASRDGQYVEGIVRHMGFRVVRGSTTRGGIKALRQLLRSATRENLAITPDGPKGPRRTFQFGVVYLASRAAVPLVPVGFAFDRAWRAKSWDRLALPKPLSRAACCFGQPICVPNKADRTSLMTYQQIASDAMARATAGAESLVMGRPADASVVQTVLAPKMVCGPQ
jgi:lysophospholipid acyltransferase (LPLAT)-like uncharacterized protein